MTDKTAELLEAAKAVLPFLQASTDHRDYLRSIRTATLEEDKKALEKAWKQDEQSPADRLRKQADEIEAKDAAIKRFRDAVAALSEG